MTAVDPALPGRVPSAPETGSSGEKISIENPFNSETFVFAGAPDDVTRTAFEVILGEGGTGGGNALEHVHPLADETFLVTSGRLRVVVAGNEHFVEAGQSFTVPRGRPHHFANCFAGQTVATVSFSPVQQHLRFFRQFAGLTQAHPNWFSAKGDPHLLLIALFLHRYPDHLYLSGPPIWLQKALFRILAPVARWRGYTLAPLPQPMNTT